MNASTMNPDQLLADGELEVIGRLTTASNTTLLGTVRSGQTSAACVYKPVRGERPLHDFPSRTLALRERAAYLVARAMGFDWVPHTILRDGPLGTGMVQRWIGPMPQYEQTASPDDPEPTDQPEPLAEIVDLFELDAVPEGWHPVIAAEDSSGTSLVLCHADSQVLREVALFDAVVNNADRKGAHLLTSTAQLYAVDHGLTFHPEPKLRTILWGFAGEDLDSQLCAALQRLLTHLPELDELTRLLTVGERQGVVQRASELLQQKKFPDPPDDRMAIPWPPL